MESSDRRAEIGLKAIEASDAADERQYRYHLEKLRTNAQERENRRLSDLRITWARSCGVAAVQREVATEVLRTVGTAIGGAGAVWLLILRHSKR